MAKHLVELDDAEYSLVLKRRFDNQRHRMYSLMGWLMPIGGIVSGGLVLLVTSLSPASIPHYPVSVIIAIAMVLPMVAGISIPFIWLLTSDYQIAKAVKAIVQKTGH